MSTNDTTSNAQAPETPSPKPRNWLQTWWDNVTAPSLTPIADSMEEGFKRMEAQAREARKRAKVKARHDAITQITYRLMEAEALRLLHSSSVGLADLPRNIERGDLRVHSLYQTATAIYDATERASQMAQVAEGTIVKPDNT